METITITHPEARDFMRELHNGDIEIKVDSYSQVSDGYHTIEELYDHRMTLYVALCSVIHAINVQYNTPMDVWRSKTHGDGKPAYDGWFIMGIGREKGEQISYHIPIARWDETDFAETLPQAPVWDGHTSADVLERLKKL